MSWHVIIYHCNDRQPTTAIEMLSTLKTSIALSLNIRALLHISLGCHRNVQGVRIIRSCSTVMYIVCLVRFVQYRNPFKIVRIINRHFFVVCCPKLTSHDRSSRLHIAFTTSLLPQGRSNPCKNVLLRDDFVRRALFNMILSAEFPRLSPCLLGAFAARPDREGHMIKNENP